MKNGCKDMESDISNAANTASSVNNAFKAKSIASVLETSTNDHDPDDPTITRVFLITTLLISSYIVFLLLGTAFIQAKYYQNYGLTVSAISETSRSNLRPTLPATSPKKLEAITPKNITEPSTPKQEK